MIVKPNIRTLRTLEQVRAFLAGTASVSFEPPAKSGRYAWIVGILRQLGYARLKRHDDEDRKSFLATLAWVQKRCGWLCPAYWSPRLVK
jgi:hypothetical protein